MLCTTVGCRINASRMHNMFMFAQDAVTTLSRVKLGQIFDRMRSNVSPGLAGVTYIGLYREHYIHVTTPCPNTNMCLQIYCGGLFNY